MKRFLEQELELDINLQLFADEPEVEEEDDGSEPEEGEETSDEEEEEKPSDTFSKEQVEGIVKGRVKSLSKRVEKLSSFKDAVDKICEITGLDFEALSARLSGMSVQEQAAILGVTPQEAEAMRVANKAKKSSSDENTKLSRQLQIVQLKEDKKYSDISIYSDEINDLLDDNPNLTVKQAYLLVKGDSALEQERRKGEQLAMAEVVKGNKKGIVKPGSSSEGPKSKISETDLSAANALGMDVKEYVNFKNIDNIDAYRASKKQKK